MNFFKRFLSVPESPKGKRLHKTVAIYNCISLHVNTVYICYYLYTFLLSLHAGVKSMSISFSKKWPYNTCAVFTACAWILAKFIANMCVRKTYREALALSDWMVFGIQN